MVDMAVLSASPTSSSIALPRRGFSTEVTKRLAKDLPAPSDVLLAPSGIFHNIGNTTDGQVGPSSLSYKR
ncbi:hypothetical protein N7491_005158 [Penicillium cf. griseofulvum]|uniref:Uncharacterized protein n=1 Tax=Penicillium cf. griseofulvum TaxID=2972120 RepID=A0A9W9J2Y0_9EURO|nr:hypothetical protein N7472_007851 [Penicillium cf. griseofulvum]KAJ5434563.1 hypothetical protein N7491_005158 [Penicillium cf. griseofulvum]KAJ5452392.1 hypothetical protein N7445_000575 [Penicillium cf. griseofulvum]